MRQMQVGMKKIAIFGPTSRFISEIIQDSAKVTVERNMNTFAVYRLVSFRVTLSDLAK